MGAGGTVIGTMAAAGTLVRVWYGLNHMEAGTTPHQIIITQLSAYWQAWALYEALGNTCLINQY